MSRSSGRFSRYPAVNRDVPGHGATYAERAGSLTSAPVSTREAVTPAPVGSDGTSVLEVNVDGMTVAEVLEWVGDDQDRARAAVEAERAGRNRRGIVDTLSG